LGKGYDLRVATVYFSGGAKVAVSEDAGDIRERLAESDGFVDLKTADGRDVYVAAGQIAYIEQDQDRPGGGPSVGRRTSPHKIQ
jgi:hypothetical protein